MEETNRLHVIRWLAVLALGTAAALLVTWLAHVAGVPLRTLLSVGVGAIALGWLVLLVAVPWNLYFAARRVVVQMGVSAERGMTIPQTQRAEAIRIARRLLWFALGGHVVTALVTIVITYFSGESVGYYFTGFYLLSVTIRPAIAYFAHLRERISALSRESTHPREDVLTIRGQVDELADTVRQLTAQLPQAMRGLTDDLRRTETRLTDDISHARSALSADVARVQDAQAADRESARTGDENLGRRIDQMVRRMQETLEGVSDHQELQAGIRALVRMIRADAGA